jgi:glutathione S-transferase
MAVASNARLTLYHWAPSRSMTARWMLEEVGQPYDIELIDLSKGAQANPDFLRVNPMGKVPALRHGDTFVTETAAICCYLADAFPEAKLAPAMGDPLRGPYLKWLFFGPSCIEPAITQRSMGWPEARRGMLGWGSFDDVVEVLRGAVAHGPYILGEQFTAADVVIGAGIRWGMEFKLLPELAEFSTYSARLAARPALQRQRKADMALMSASTVDA